MGYTHYWTFKKSPKDIENGAEKFKNAVLLFKAGIEKMRESKKQDLDGNILDYTNLLGNGWGEGEPIIEDSKLIFNGKTPDDHETFAITMESEDFDFCKTARKPYDPFVCLALLCFENEFGDDIEVSSDGDRNSDEGWVIANLYFSIVQDYIKLIKDRIQRDF